MNYYFTTTDKAWLDEVNGRGFGADDRVTSQWVTIYKHPTREEWAAEIPEDYAPRLGEVLTADELASITPGLKPWTIMAADGWFPPVVLPDGN